MSKAPPLRDFQKDAQDTVYQILANAAERKAKASREKEEKTA